MPASTLRLHCFGGLWLEGPGGPLADAASQRRRLALLALVAASGPSGISRDRVLSYLWAGSDADHARRALAQLVYSMRRSLGRPLIAGDAELRIEPESLTSDVADFLEAAGDFDRAVALYAGTFLDGFHLAGAPEFGRWVERERDRLSGLAGTAMERAARSAGAGGNHALAVALWRRRAALTPLDPGPALALMDALAASGDRGGAVQHARLYGDMVRAELEMDPDPRVSEAADRLRLGASHAPNAARLPAPGERTAPSPRRRATDQAAPPSGPAPRRWPLAAMAALALAGAASLMALWPRADATPLLAVGDVRFLPESGADADAFVDLFATNLARVGGVQVLSNARVQEVYARLRRADSAVSPARAAAVAGAQEVLEGTVRHLGGRLQLDLQRVDLRSGTVRAAFRVTGRDPFELADTATAAVAGQFRLATPPTAIASVTTHSLPAYRLYQAGLRAFNDGELGAAFPLFAAAVGEDSMFPMAAFYAWRAALGAAPYAEAAAYRQLVRVAGRGTERERLFIQGTIAALLTNVSAVAIAETLAIRYPSEPDAHLMLARVRSAAGDFLGAIAEARQVRRMEPLPAPTDATCRSCDAFALEIGALVSADSLPAAKRTAHEWIALAPQSLGAHGALIDVLEREGRFAAAESALAAIDSIARTPRGNDLRPVNYLIRGGRFAEADARLRAAMLAMPAQAPAARWLLLISLRNQGRFAEALELALESGASQLPPQATGHALFEVGRYAEAVTWFDSLAGLPGRGSPGNEARARTWALAHLATALASAGDTSRLAAVAADLERTGAMSLYGRDRLLFHYARGLLLAARGDDAGAAGELAAAVSSPTEGFTRIQYELARIHLRHNRPVAAIAVLSPALRGSIDASNYYVTRTEIHELLGRAYERVGRRDSAAAEYGRVGSAWAAADAPFRIRAAAARERAIALGPR